MNWQQLKWSKNSEEDKVSLRPQITWPREIRQMPWPLQYKELQYSTFLHNGRRIENPMEVINCLWPKDGPIASLVKEDFVHLHLTSKILIKTLRVKHPLKGNEITPEAIRTARSQQDPVPDWLQDHDPISFSRPTCRYPPLPHLFLILYKSRSIFSTLETVYEMLVLCLPSAGLSEINSSLASPPLTSLPLDFVSCDRPNLVCLGPPRAHALSYILAPLATLSGQKFCWMFIIQKAGRGKRSSALGSPVTETDYTTHNNHLS